MYKFIIKRNDVYVISKEKKNEMKLSAHESGVCQVSLTAEYIKKSNLEIKNCERHLIKKELLLNPDGFEIIHALYFPKSEIVLNSEIQKQKVIWIDMPKKNEAVELLVCMGNTVFYGFNFNERKVLRTDVLENGKVFLILYRNCTISRKLRESIFVTKENALKFKKQNNIEDRMCSTCLFENDAGMLCELEVYV